MSETWIVGINPVEGALANDPSRVREVLVEQGTHNPRVTALVDEAKRLGVRVHSRPRAMLDKVSDHARHQGVAANYEVPAAKSEHDLADLLEIDDALFLVLDGVTDPHNLGACLRSAAAAGVTAIIAPKDRAVGITPVVRRASAGAVDRVPLIEVTNLARALRDMKDAGVWLTGLAGEAEMSLYDVDLKGKVALVMGGEGEGMRRLTREACDHLARIPMPGSMESLNVSVATGVALFEAVRQREGEIMSMNITIDWTVIVGLVGMIITLVAYFLLQAQKLHGNGLIYQLMNAVGALGVAVSLLFGTFNLPAFLLEVVWLAISIYGIMVARRIRVQ